MNVIFTTSGDQLDFDVLQHLHALIAIAQKLFRGGISIHFMKLKPKPRGLAVTVFWPSYRKFVLTDYVPPNLLLLADQKSTKF